MLSVTPDGIPDFYDLCTVVSLIYSDGLANAGWASLV